MYKLLERRYPDPERRLTLYTELRNGKVRTMDFTNNQWVDNQTSTSTWSTSGVFGGSVESNVKRTQCGTSEIDTPEQYAADPLGPLYLKIMSMNWIANYLSLSAIGSSVGVGFANMIWQACDSMWSELIFALKQGPEFMLEIIKTALGDAGGGIIVAGSSFVTAFTMFLKYQYNKSQDLLKIAKLWNEFVAAAEGAQNKVNTTFDEDGNPVYSGYKLQNWKVRVVSSETITIESKGYKVRTSMKKSAFFDRTNNSYSIALMHIEVERGTVELIEN